MLLQPEEKLEEQIIRILAQYPGATANEIHEKILSRGESYTLQAIYKDLSKLVEAQVLTKVKFGFFLRMSWILNLVEFAQQTHGVYADVAHEDILPEYDKTGKRSWTFRNLVSCDSLWGHVLLMMLLKSKSQQLLIWNAYPWHALQRRETRPRFREAVASLQSRFYILMGKPTFLTDLCIKDYPGFYQVAYHPPMLDKYETTILCLCDDFIFSIEYPMKIANRIRELFETTNSSSRFERSPLMDICYADSKIKLTIERDSKKAAKLAKPFQLHFADLNS